MNTLLQKIQKIEFEAVGTIKLFTNIQAVQTEEVDFFVVYFRNDKCK